MIYTNDLVQEIDANEALLYADDTVFYEQGDRIDDIIEKAQQGLERADKWMETNGMRLNKEKTVLMIYISNKNPEAKNVEGKFITIGREIIRPSKYVKYLGISFDGQNKWEEQLKNSRNKIRSLIPMLLKIRDVVDIETRKKIYHTMIESRLSYAIGIWGQMNRKRMDELQRTQNIVLRILFNKGRYANIDQMMKELKIQNCYEITLYQLTRKAWTLLNTENKIGKIELKESGVRDGMDTRLTGIKIMDVPKWNTNWGKRKGGKRMAEIINIMEEKLKIITSPSRKWRFPKKEIKKVWSEMGKHKIRDCYW